MIAWMISEFSYVFGLIVSRLMLAEIIVIDCIVYQVRSVFIKKCCRNFQRLEMIMMIYRFKGIFMLIENFRKLGPLQLVSELRIWDRN